MDAINRAKRRFFLRPGYIARHAGDVVKLALTQAGDRLAGAARTIFGAKVVDIKPAARRSVRERRLRELAGRDPASRPGAAAAGRAGSATGHAAA